MYSKEDNMIIVIIAVILLIIFTFTLSWNFSNKIIKIRVHTTDEMDALSVENQWYDIDWYNTLQKSILSIPSQYGYDIAGTLILADKPTDYYVILSHGVTMGEICSRHYLKLFHNLGYNVITYDHRRHGQTEGLDSTYGHFEKYDLKSVIDHFKASIGSHIKIGLHGESMGAAVILQYGTIAGDADFYISDCAYSSLYDQLSARIKSKRIYMTTIIMQTTRFIIKFRAGFDIKKIRPVDDVKNITVPILFIHGSDDTYINPDMTQELYDACTSEKRLYLCPDAGHARSMTTDPERYHSEVEDFLRENKLI